MNSIELKEKFNFSDEVYINFSPLTDVRVGFSVRRNYPKHIRFSPPKLRNGSDDVVAVTQVVYNYPDYMHEPKDKTKVPIFIKIFSFSIYLQKHFDYDFSDENCPTEESVLLSKSTPQPIDLEAENEFYYDEIHDKFFNKKGKIFTGKEILNFLFEQHCNTVHLFKGFKLRFKINFHNRIFISIGSLIEALKWMLKVCFGRQLTSDELGAGMLRTYKKEDMKLLKTDSIDIFGYKSSKNVIVTYSVLVIISYLFLYFKKIKSPFFLAIASHNILTVTTSIIALVLLDHLCPFLFFLIINFLIEMRINRNFRKKKNKKPAM
jgi:hypothetical protein